MNPMVYRLRKQWIESILEVARRVADETGHVFIPEIVAAQAALESNYGKSALAKNANNLFGIKAGKKWTGDTVTYKTIEYDANGQKYEVEEQWRKYGSIEECLRDYAAILQRLSWYADAVEAAKNGDIIGFLDGLLPKDKSPGWSTDPLYKSKILRVATLYGLI